MTSSIDHLFDRGLIGFEDSGDLMVSPVTHKPSLQRMGVETQDAGKDSAREIREYFIPDFSNWKDHDAYQAAFQRLVRDLKAEGKARTSNSDIRSE